MSSSPSTQLIEAPALVDGTDGWHIIHVCDYASDDIALCGKDITDLPWALDEADEEDCVVCTAMEAADPLVWEAAWEDAYGLSGGSI